MEENKETIKEEKKDVKDLTPEEINKLKYKDRQDKEMILSKVIKGVNDVWEKEYNFEEMDLKFKVKVRLPNAIDQGRILALRSMYLGGTDQNHNLEILQAYHMLATLQEVGVEVPIEFRDPEEVYNLYPLMIMYQDWVNFQNTFRY